MPLAPFINIMIITLTILTLIFVLIWLFISKYPNFILRLLPYMRNRFVNDQSVHVLSAETPNGKEAEFINEGLPEKNKIKHFFRAALILVYFIIMIYIIYSK